MTTAKSCNKCVEEETCSSCCKKCPDCPNCYDLDIEKIREYLFAIDDKVVKHNESKICTTDWGYACKPVKDDQFEKLLIFKDYLYHYYESLRLKYYSGICPDEVQKVLEATSKIITLNYHSSEDFSNVIVDDSDFDKWVINNPYCVAWEDWELYVPKMCPKLGINVLNVKDACNLVFDIQVDEIEDNCKFLYTLSVASIAQKNKCVDLRVENLIKCDIDYQIAIKNIDTCNLTYEVKSELIDCKTKYDILIKEHNCNLDFNTYISLLNCNLSHEVISNIIECNVDIEYSVEEKCPILKTKNGVYNLSNVTVNIFDENVDPNYLKSIFKVSADRNDIKLLTESYKDSHLINKEIND